MVNVPLCLISDGILSSLEQHLCATFLEWLVSGINPLMGKEFL